MKYVGSDPHTLDIILKALYERFRALIRKFFPNESNKDEKEVRRVAGKGGSIVHRI
jgi:hypothetical protein